MQTKTEEQDVSYSQIDYSLTDDTDKVKQVFYRRAVEECIIACYNGYGRIDDRTIDLYAKNAYRDVIEQGAVANDYYAFEKIAIQTYVETYKLIRDVLLGPPVETHVPISSIYPGFRGDDVARADTSHQTRSQFVQSVYFNLKHFGYVEAYRWISSRMEQEEREEVIHETV